MKVKRSAKFYTIAILLAVFLITALLSCVNLFSGISKTARAEENVWEIENGVVLSYNGTEEIVTVPGEFNGVVVTKIGKNAFESNNDVKKVILPDSIDEILDRAFIYCKNLESINFPSKLKVINTWAFGYCYALDNITFPEGLKEIGSASFYGCRNLKKVEMPNSVVALGTHAFRACNTLETVVLSNSIKTIPLRTFSGCSKLKSVDIPDGVVTVGLESFYECTELKFVTFPSSIKTIENHAFYNCRNLRAVDIKDGVTSIGERAFSGCNKILTVRLPSSLLSIGANAFDRCYKINEIYNYSNLSLSIGEKTENGGVAYYAKNVYNTSDYQSKLVYDNHFVFYVGEEIPVVVDYQGEDKDVVLPSSFNGEDYDIGDYAFYSLNGVETLTIHESVKNIGYYSFYDCFSIKEIRFDGTKGVWLEVAIDKGNSVLENVIYNKVWTPPTTEVDTEIKLTFFQKLTSVFKSVLKSLVTNIFLVNFFITILVGVLLIYTGSEEGKNKRKKIFVVITCIQWILISGLRADSVGADTENYLNIFDSHARMSWREIFNTFKIFITGNSSDAVSDLALEPLFVLFNKIVSLFTTNHVIYKFIIATIFMSALGTYVYKYSEDPCLSFIIYGGLFYNMFSLTGYRQVIAVAFVLFGFRFILDRKLIPFIITIIIGTLFHKTTLIFVLLYILAYKKITVKYLFTILVIFVLMVIFNHQLFEITKNIFGYEEYAGGYGFKQVTFALMFAALTAVAIITYKPIIQSNSKAIVYYNGLILSWLMFPFLIESPSTLRLVYNFLFVILPLTPLILKSFTNTKERSWIYILIYVLFAFAVWSSDFTYAFFFM